MKYLKQYIRTFAIFMLLLIAGSITNEAWAAKVTYHILTLPIDPSYYDYHMKSGVTGHRLEAFKVVVDGTTVELPAHYKSPLATGFTYYEPKDITGHGGSAVSLYDGVADCKGVLYDVKTSPTPTPVAEGTAITTNTAEYYVVYTYKTDNTIAKLDGSVNYNISVKNLGFLSYNRGRNNRPAVVKKDQVDAEKLASEDFSYVASPGNSINPYWADGSNKNTRDSTESKFFFGFKFEGKDPYHIVVRTSYARDYTYIEQNDDKKGDFVYKWYKEGALFASGKGNNYIASDDHIRYNTAYNSASPNPTDLSSGYVNKTGFFHGNKSYWSTVALLNNTSNTGYVLMGTRTVDGNGSTPASPYYMKFTGNNLNYDQISSATATNNHSIDGIYPLKKVTFKIATPFYATEPTNDHIVSAPTEWVSQYTVENNDIEPKYLPSSLLRKYCTLTGKFYSDAACTNEITRFSQADYDNTEGYKVYIGYTVDSDIPFKAITPAASYSASTWAGATWYELTDDGSTQTDGLKLKYDGTNFKNNGAADVYEKTSEFAFIGDPYELQVVYRNATSGATPYFVGAAGTPPTTGTLLTASTTASEGYKWEVADDETAGSFLLRKYKGTGNWYWDAGHPSPVAIDYTSKAHTYNVATANAQTVTFNVSNLTFAEGNYLEVTVGGTDATQATVQSEKIYVYRTETATFTVSIQGRGDGDKQFTLSIQEKKGSDNSNIGTASVITVNQKNDAIVANTVAYSTTNSTRVKVMDLPTRSFTYNIVDKSGRIAVKASATQTILSPLSLASIPSIIVSPFLYGETITFYSSYLGGGRGNLSSEITALPEGNAATSTNIYVKYTTTALDAKPINLSEDQELNVKLNGQYLYYDKTNYVIKTKANPTADELNSSEYLWKLRNRDPYAMLIDNLGAREDLGVDKQSETPTLYDDDGGTSTPSRQKGAWVTLESIVNEGALTFTKRRSSESEGSGAIAQQFIAKSSLQQAVYEVMVADGGSVDASTTYYDIACPEANTVKIYNNTTYAHGHDVLRFVLNQNVVYTYHLIDKAKHELLTADSKTPDLALPAEYQSPLVGTYNFYARDQITIDETKTPHEYTPNNPATKITNLSGLNATWDTGTYPAASNPTDWGNAADPYKLTATDDTHMLEQARLLTTTGTYHFNINNGASYKKINVTRGYQGTDIYVTYDANDIVTFNTGSYMLKFLEPYAAGYYLEDGNDKLTATQIQAVYPYCNGDGNLNIYGEEMQKEQFNGGASTRPRWIWYFVSADSDPYHVRIRSRSTISYNGASHSTYLTTYAVHFNQDTGDDEKKQRIVTGGTLPGVASAVPMEYMVLGSKNNYKLLTTEPVAVDLNGDGDTEDTVDGVSENVRRNVTSFEQYWKTYNMIKLHVLSIDKSTNSFDGPWEVPTDPALYRSTIEAKNWHSYNAYANATRWNGFNDKTNGEGKKVVEKLEHWYQTFEMGTGTFDIESADVPPVLVLLDRHGWEIMRRPLPPATTYPEGEELKDLKVYDSPLVERYYFYSNATKASGCHKYTLRLDDNDKERDQIKVNGEHYSSTSLGDLPPITATGVKSGGAFNDQFVIYTVKEEYEKNYSYNLDENTNPYTETGTSQPYLVLQNGRFYKDENTLTKPQNPSYLSKPIAEHTDPEGGNVYDLIVSPHNHGGTNNNIIDNSGNFIGNNFWYVKPNLNIDDEMGIPWIQVTGEATVDAAKNKLRKEYEKKTGFDPYNIQLQLVKNNSGDDDGRYLTAHMVSAHLDDGIMVGEYNNLTAADAGDVDAQAKKLTATGDYYFKQEDAENYWHVNVTTAYNGTTDAVYTKTGSNATEWIQSHKITLAAAGSATVTSEGYDHTTMQITNQTFMAVSDANNNMQLMPRFDHTLRVDLKSTNPWDTQLSEPKDHANKASADNNSSMGPQTTFFVNPKRFHYHIIDNNGREALRYKRGADFYPAITAHFKSPLAKDFTYYKGLAEGSIENSTVEEWGPATGNFKRTLTKESMLADAAKLLPTKGTYYYRIGTRGEFTYKKVTVAEGKGLSDKQITGSFAEANIEGVDCDVYVRYDYDEDADLDGDKVLHGQWFTVKLASKDLQADGEVMTFTKTVADETEYESAKAALSSDGVYYFKRTDTNPYTYTKVTRSGGSITGDVVSSESEWTNAQGLGVSLYTGENSLTAVDDAEYESKRNMLPAIGVYYFRIGTAESYTYKKVEVTSVPIDDASDYTETSDDGTFATLWSNSKPSVVDADDKKWQWKFLSAPTDPSSDYYVEPDPYAIQIFNRYSNYTSNPSEEPSPMAVGIKVPNETTGADRFALLSHPSGGYAFVVAKTYSDYGYPFLNGASMTTSVAATTTTEAGFNYKTGAITAGAQVVLDDDVTHHYTYYVITNGNKLAITAEQNKEEAEGHVYAPYVPESVQSPLLNMEDYEYYGFAANPSGDTYSVIPQTKLYTLFGLYDDNVYVRYKAYDVDKTSFKVPNKRNDTAETTVARDPSSVDASLNINGGLPYNIIWYDDNMMQSTDNLAVSDGGSGSLSGDQKFVWYFTENDPYALKIKHKGGKYLNGTTTMVEAASAQTFMLLRKSGYDCGILQVTGTTGANAGKKLTGFGGALTDDASIDPTKFIIFGLSVHDLIYHLIIAKTCPDHNNPQAGEYVDIDFRETESGTLGKKRIYGTTQRDLTSVNDGEGTHYAGEKYQLGETLNWYDSSTEGAIGHTYSYHAGSVSIGDEFVLPNIFSRPNCTFDFYIEGIYQHYAEANANEGKPHTGLEGKYKGLKLSKLMSDDQLIDQTVVVNVVYSFDNDVATNTGLGFVTSTDQNLWYTFETPEGETPYLAQYTNAWGLQAKSGRDTRYTNDYLWTPLGDVYGFKMYNRYMLKNSGGVKNVMTMSAISEGQNLLLAQPSTTESPTIYPAGYEIFELISGDMTGYFRVHPVVNKTGTQYYVRKDPADNYAKLSTTPCDWRYGLEMDLLEPYYERAGYVGGLTDPGKTAYETAVATGLITEIQKVVYNDANIVHYTPGYYRLHSQPGVSGISPVRYASGYLHNIEKTAVTGGIPMHFYSKEGVTASFAGTEGGLSSGFTVTNATRGEIPIAPTETDPSTIFYFNGTGTLGGNPRSTMQTQGLYVAANPMGDTTGDSDKKEGKGTNRLQRAVMKETENPAEDAITFSLMDIGGAVLLIHDGSAPATRRYLNYDQSNFFQRTATNVSDMQSQAAELTSKGTYYFKINDGASYLKIEVETPKNGETPASYTPSVGTSSTSDEWNKAADLYDLKYYHESPTDDAKWCMVPAETMVIATNDGGDGYYYATFYAPFDVLLPDNITADPSKDISAENYYAYFCKTWDNAGLHPTPVPAVNTYSEGKFVPAGTPVIIRTTDESNSVTLTLPSTSPTASSITTDLKGSYLEQLLTADAAHDVYTLGLPMTSTIDSYNKTTGEVVAPLPEFDTNGVGFYINATYNKESDPLQSLWSRNNNYVLHNKIYYRAANPSLAPQQRGPEFVPVIFDDLEEPDEELNPEGAREIIGDGCVYDLMGRKVATREQVEDGSWKQRVASGIYIINGKKIRR